MINAPYCRAGAALCCVLLSLALAAMVAAAKKPDNLILKHADTIENSIVNGRFFSVLRGNVTFEYDSTIITCDQAQWWRDEGRITATGQIAVTQPGQRLTCNRIDYNRDNSTLTGSGDVVFIDSREGVKVSGQTCRYNLETRFCVLEGAPRVFRFDTASAETLAIASVKMLYNDSLKRTSALGTVTITKGPLLSQSERAHYFTEKEIAQLRDNPRITYEAHRLKGDSIDLRFRNDTLEGMSVKGSTHGVYFEYGATDTMRTQLWGDSLYMALTDSGTLDSIWIFRNVKSAYCMISDTSQQNAVNGRKMVLAFGGPRGEIRQAEVTGNATSTYFLEDNQGRNEASGDTLTVWFNEGRARRLRLGGGVRGMYYPPQNQTAASDSAHAEKKKS